MRFKTEYWTTISFGWEEFNDRAAAKFAARAWIKSLLTPGAKKAGETFRRMDANTFAIRNAAGSHPAVATVSPL